MRYVATLTILSALLVGCPKEEPPPPEPPVLGAVDVVCASAEGQDYDVVSKVTVNVTDEDRDLVIDSIKGSVNGLQMELDDGDTIDDVFEWTPPGSWDPTMVCRGDFRLIVEAADAGGRSFNEVRVVEK